MWRRVFLLGVAAAATACTVPNPRNCANGKACTDPSIPFCDVDGQIAGEPNTCVAVSCTPGEFGACRGDVALTCNAEGNDFDLLQCPLGCDPAGGGCRLSEPGQTACTNGTLATCDASGAVVESEVCPLGCFEDEPRCRDIDPSNGLAKFLDMVPDPPNLDLTGGATITGATATSASTRAGDVQSPRVGMSVASGGGGGGLGRIRVNTPDQTFTTTNTTIIDAKLTTGVLSTR